MKHSAEGEVLRWLERALDQPSDHRLAWLERQSLPAWLYERVRRLVDAESRLEGTFLERVPLLPDDSALPKPGERFGAYELLRQIDAGGMGVVFLARRADSAYEQQVAVKLIRPLHAQSSPGVRQQLIARFENERALLARLDHRNIARIIDGGTAPSGIPYLVMEYVEGQSLIDYCNSRSCDVRERLVLFRKVCAGVQEAHRNLIVHRDLKPENILVPADGEPRLLDFGIARTLEAGQERVEHPNLTSLTVMTPAYASPEQVKREPLTTSSDVYSLGVVLYQMLAGARPYDLSRATPAEAQRLVCEADPVPMRNMLARASSLSSGERKMRRAQLTSELERIVAKAMHKDSARRYASARELGDDVERYLQGQPVLAHPDSPLYRMTKFVGRHRASSAIAALALVAVLVASGFAIRQGFLARQAAADTELVNGFLLDVLSMSDPFDAGSELTLSQALDEAAKRIDERFADRPDLTAQIRFGIGYSMLSRYRLDEAEQQLLRAKAESEAQFGRNDIRTLRVMEGIAGLRHEQGRIDEAIALYGEAIADAERFGWQRDPLYVDLLGNLGNLYLTQERYEDAQRWMRKASDAAAGNPENVSPLDRANLVSNLAHAAHGLENLEEADRLYAQAQSAYSSLFPDGNPDLASLLNNRALLAEDRGEPAQALELHKQSLAVRQRVFGAEHPMVVTALGNVARMATAQGDKGLGLSRAQEAVAMADRVYTEPQSRHASVYATLAGARAANGDVAGAVEAWRKGQSILATVSNAPPSVGAYLERVRAQICRSSETASLCAALGEAASQR